MLYPKEDRQTHQLMFACSTCQYSEKASSSCVFRNNLDTTIGETAGVTQDVGSDPTVGIPGFCALCQLPIRCSFCDEMSGEGIMFYVAEEHEDDRELAGSNEDDQELEGVKNGLTRMLLGKGVTKSLL